jgi:hypothetical protein
LLGGTVIGAVEHVGIVIECSIQVGASRSQIILA